jgi:hypothetical protein
MNELKNKPFLIFVCVFSVSTLLFLLAFTGTVLAEQPLLKKYIVEFNLKAVEKSLADNTYRGEEGILAVNPEEAVSLGLKAVIDEDYLESMRLLKEAEECLEKAKKAMASSVKELSSGYYAGEIYKNYLKYKNNSAEAKKILTGYHSRLNRGNDDRLSEDECARIIDRVLDESLSSREYGLRDKLALFYNTCHGINKKNYPLTDDNARFVNYVFNGFINDASQEEKNRHDLDLAEGYNTRGLYNWKDAADFGTSEYVVLLESSLKKLGDGIYPVDPLLFMAVIKKESGFDPLAVSSVGAAGLTQIMPETAKDLGMKDIFMPDYYKEAVSLIKKERNAKNSALSTLKEINDENGLKLADQARKQMQESLTLGRKRARLFEKYEKDLVKNRNDARLQASLSIEYGLKYFAGLMKRYNGDISLALASYNAGEYRVKDFNGIPPYKETVGFRNKILQYYREYLDEVIDK